MDRGTPTDRASPYRDRDRRVVVPPTVCLDFNKPPAPCVFITAGPITKLLAWVEGESGRHVL